MAAERFQNAECENDDELGNDIKKYVMQNLKREEVLDFLKRDYLQYVEPSYVKQKDAYIRNQVCRVCYKS